MSYMSKKFIKNIVLFSKLWRPQKSVSLYQLIVNVNFTTFSITALRVLENRETRGAEL